EIVRSLLRRSGVSPPGASAVPHPYSGTFTGSGLACERVDSTREPPLWFGGRVLVDVFGLLVFGQSRVSQFPADTRTLETAPFGLRPLRADVVDSLGAVALLAGHVLGFARVTRPHRPGQAVGCVVIVTYGSLDAGEPFHGHDRTERLLLHHPHVASALV